MDIFEPFSQREMVATGRVRGYDGISAIAAISKPDKAGNFFQFRR